MNATLFRKEIKSNWILLVIFLGVLSVYSVMITMMFDPRLGDSLRMMADSMPQMFAAFGMQMWAQHCWSSLQVTYMESC